MKIKRIITIGISLTLGLIYILWNNGTINPNKTKVNEDVYLIREKAGFSVKYRTKEFSKQTDKTIAKSVDSLIISYKFGTMVHGFGNSDKVRSWYYIDTSHGKNVYGGFSNSEFRNKEIETIGRTYLDSIFSAQEIWEKYN
jgi:hypothetical protein